MDSSSFDNHSKASAFKKFRHLLYKYFPRFSKICKGSVHLNQFLNKLLMNANVLQLGMGKSLIAALYREITKTEIVFDEKKSRKKAKITKRAQPFKNYAHSYNVEILNSFNPELHLKNTELAIKNKLKTLLNEFRGLKICYNLHLKIKKKR